jgi:mannose-6-phosphate isomerase-like protein (cupin superfamily)
MGLPHAAACGHVLRYNKNREEGAMTQSKGIRRVVTAHDAAGKAVVGFDGMASVSGGEPELGVETITLWVTDGTPAGLDGTKDARETRIGIPPPKNGSIFRIVDFHPATKEMENLDPNFLAKIAGQKLAPGTKPPRHPGMHRTRSIDYLAVLSGEIDMLLDDSEVHLKAGDVMVQRGTVHAWINRGKEVCRIAVAMIDAKEPKHLAKKPKPKKARAALARKGAARKAGKARRRGKR